MQHVIDAALSCPAHVCAEYRILAGRDTVQANPVLPNFLLESALLPRTRYHVHERVALSRVRLLNTRELFSTVCLLTKHAISV